MSNTKEQLICLLCVLAAGWAGGCGVLENLDYTPAFEVAELQKLKGARVALLGFGYSDAVLRSGDPAGPEVARVVLEHQKATLAAGLAELFEIVESTEAELGPAPWNLDAGAGEHAAGALEALGADAGVMVVGAYGYKMSGSLLSGVLEEVAGEHKDKVRVLTGPSSVESYYLASNMILVNREGRVIWRFAGKISALPGLDLSLEGFTRSVVGLDPAGEALAQALSGVAEHYARYNAWQLARNMEGSRATHYYSDFPEEMREAKISLYPVSAVAFTPLLDVSEASAGPRAAE